MISSNFELVVTFGLGVIISAFIYFFARKSLSEDDDENKSLPKEESNLKNKISKKTIKSKIVKKDANHVKPKIGSKNQQNHVVITTNVVVNKSQESVREVVGNANTVVVERIRNDSTAEWTKVSKPTKKSKSSQIKTDTDNVVIDDMIKVAVRENASAELPTPILKAEKEVGNKQKKEINHIKVEPVKETIVEKASEKFTEPKKTVKSKKFVTNEEPSTSNTNSSKPNVVIEEVKPKSVTNNDEEMQAKIFEMMVELDKMKNSQKEENKPSNQTNREMETLKNKLKISQTNEEKLLEDVRKKGQAVTDLKNQFLIIQSELTKNIVANQSIIRDKTGLENRNRTLEEQITSLSEKAKLYEQLEIENEGLQKNFSIVEQDLKNVKRMSADTLKSCEMELSNKITMLQTEKHRMQDQLVRVQTDLIDNNNKMQSIQQELQVAKNAHSDLLKDNMKLQTAIADLEKSTLSFKKNESADFENRSKQYEEQIALLRAQIDDLKALNNDLSAEKSALLQEVEQVRSSEVTSTNSQITELSEKIHLLEKQSYDKQEELSNSQKCLQEYKTEFENLSLQMKELSTERDSLVTLVDQYKTGLESTELILSKLQTSVNEEENKWRESLLKSENEAEKSKKELEIVYNDLTRIRNSRADKNELNFAYHCVDKSLSSLIDEMEARMIHFEKSLETVVQERDSALAQISLQINGVADKHETGEDHPNSIHNDECELDKVKSDLNNQIELNKALENNCNKFRSLIDIGKDALEEEKTHVKELQEELKSLKSLWSASSANNSEITNSS